MYFIGRLISPQWILLSLILLQKSLCTSNVLVLPTIIISPRNYVFSCQGQTIHVASNDQLNFGCPLDGYNNYGKIGQVYENFYYLGEDEQAYNSCNATGARKLLNCGSSSPSIYNVVFRTFLTSGDSFAFKEGSMHYFIGTGYRTADKLNNSIGGSCNTSGDGEYNIRLKIYVCTQEEIDSGKCNRCKSEACYYRDCAKNCTDWTTVSESIENRTLFQSRQCTNELLSDEISTTEYQTIVASQSPNCSTWEVEPIKDVTVNKTMCSYLDKRTCVNSLGQSVSQFKEYTSNCVAAPTAAPRATATSDDSNTYKYLAIGATIGGFIIGLIFGAFIYKVQGHHGKACPKINKLEPNRKEHKKSQINHGYDRSSGYDQFDGKPIPKKHEQGGELTLKKLEEGQESPAPLVGSET